eukprot:c20927_g2_i1 orf=305-679(-)
MLIFPYLQYSAVAVQFMLVMCNGAPNSERTSFVKISECVKLNKQAFCHGPHVLYVHLTNQIKKCVHAIQPEGIGAATFTRFEETIVEKLKATAIEVIMNEMMGLLNVDGAKSRIEYNFKIQVVH